MDMNRINEYFYAMGKGAQGEVPNGAWYAYRAWRNTREFKTSMFEVTEVPWGSKAKQEAVDFVAALREAGVTEIAVTESGSALMESIHALVEAGAKLAGTVMVDRKPEYDLDEKCPGLKFIIPEGSCDRFDVEEHDLDLGIKIAVEVSGGLVQNIYASAHAAPAIDADVYDLDVSDFPDEGEQEAADERAAELQKLVDSGEYTHIW